MRTEIDHERIRIVRYTEKEISDVLDFEKRLREEEDFDRPDREQ